MTDTVYVKLTKERAGDLLLRAGLHVARLYVHSDGAATAIFSRLQPYTQDERIQRLLALDARITMLDQGKLPDSSESFIDFALLDINATEGRP